MDKNLIYTVAIDHNSSQYLNSNYSKYSLFTWQSWCKKNNIDFLVLDNHNTFFNNPKWNKYTIFDYIGDKYNKIIYVDSDTMIKWDAPNPFNFYNEDELCGVIDNSSLRWIHNSINSYQKFYPNIKLLYERYFNSGVVFFSKKHKYLHDNLKKLYKNHFKELDKITGVGKDQTILNFEVTKTKTKFTPLLPVWNLFSIHKKEMFSYNWQLNEDQVPHFVRYSYLWHFTGFSIEDRIKIMGQVWEKYKNNYNINILDRCNNKNTHKWTTSKKFKGDILSYFKQKEFKNKTLVELGCCRGDTTRIYSECFKNVVGSDKDPDNIKLAIENNKELDNVKIIEKDLYNSEWDMPPADVVVIDAGHTYEDIMRDVPKVIEYFLNPIIIMDDYGNPKQDVNRAINELESSGIIKINKKIGADKGYTTATGLVFNDKEGVICNV